MKKQIVLDGRNIEYTLKMSKKSRSIRLTIHHDGSFVVTVPRYVNENIIEQFIAKKSKWIIDKLEYFKNIPQPVLVRSGKGDYIKYKGEALTLAQERLEHFNKIYGFKFNKISIKNQKTRWGSCSTKGNLNFNYKIVLLPQRLSDYIIVHELCHLKEFNHAQRFWDLVARAVPDYLEIRSELKSSGIRFY